MRDGRCLPALFGLLWLLLLAVGPAHAGQGEWTGGGPEGGAIAGLAVDPTTPTTIYAASVLNGVFKSTNSAATWSAAGQPGDPAFNISRLTVGPDGTLYVLQLCCIPNEVHKSVDGGQSWTASGSGLDGFGRRPQSIQVDPSAASVVYVGTNSEGVFKSTDSGVTWAASNNGIADKRVTAIAIDPGLTSTIYAGTALDGVFKSTDSGANWVAMSTGLTSLGINALLIDPGTTTTLYAGTDDGGVFKSSDGGATWAAADTGLPADAEVLSLGVDPATSTTLFAGLFGQLFRSTDGGANWSEVAAGVSGVKVNAIQAVSSSATKVFVASDAGVATSTDAGDTWTNSNSGLEAFFADGLVAEPPATTTVYTASSQSGVFKSTDAGGTWQAVNTGLPTRAISGQGKGLSISTGNPQTLYVGLGTDVARTTDGGTSWSPSGADAGDFGLFGAFILPVAADPIDPNTVFAGNLAIVCCGLSTPALLKSTDGGTNWTAGFEAADPMSQHQPTEIVVDPTDPQRLYAGALFFNTDNSFGFHVLRSLDGGGSFHEVVSEPDGGLAFPYLAIDPNESSTAYAVVRRPVPTIHRTLDGGDTWTALTPNLLPDLTASDIETHPAIAGRVYLAIGSLLLASRDRGDTWAEFDVDGLPTHNLIRSIAISPTGSTTIHAGTTGGVYSYTSSCGFPENLDLGSRTVEDTRSFIACDSIVAGSGFAVVSPGKVRFEAGGSITLENGFSVGADGELALLTEPF